MPPCIASLLKVRERMPGSDPVIEARCLTIGRPDQKVAEGINLSLKAGQSLGIAGPNGIGKTTLLESLAGLLAPLEGEVYASGELLSGMSSQDRARLMTFCIQREKPSTDFTVSDLVLMGRMTKNSALWETPEDVEAASEAMRLFGVDSMASKPVSKISGGELQRSLLARTWATGAPTLLLDEPTASLDMAGTGVLSRRIKQRDRCVIVASHDLGFLASCCDRLLVMGKAWHSLLATEEAGVALERAFNHPFLSVEIGGTAAYLPDYSGVESSLSKPPSP